MNFKRTTSCSFGALVETYIRAAILSLSVLILSSTVHSAFAGNNITVTNANDAGAGSLRVAINNLASSGDTIRFTSSLFNDTIKLTSGQIIINKNLAIIGLGDDSIFISGNNNSRIFKILSDDTVDIEKLSLVKGMDVDSGGAVYNSGYLTMKYCTLKNNSATQGGSIVNRGATILTGCIVRNNSSSGYGGGIFSVAGSLSATNCSLLNNTSVSGGGAVACTGSSAIFTDLNIDGNSGNKGGGIYSESSLIIISSTISNNSAGNGNGGGIFNSGNGRITDCTIENNSTSNVSYSGGGIFNDSVFSAITSSVRDNQSTGTGGGISNSGALSVVSSSIHNNSANSSGGGIENQGIGVITSSTISTNTSGQSGGGIHSSISLTISRSTVASNESGANGGGIYTNDTLRFSNTIVADNTADNQGPEIYKASGLPVSQGHNLVRDISQSGFTPSSGDILGTNANPVEAYLGSLQNNGGSTLTHLPGCKSPAIDAGDSTSATLVDQRGEPRIHGANIDMGAVEVQTDPITIDAVITNESTTGAADGVIQAVVSGGTAPYFYDWSTGSHNVTIGGLHAGSYSVTVNDFFSCGDSAVFTVALADGIAYINAGTILTYPNPTNDLIIISSTSPVVSVEILDFRGKLVKSFIPFSNSKHPSYEIDVKDLSEGCYWVTLRDGSGKMSKGKFLKVR